MLYSIVSPKGRCGAESDGQIRRAICGAKTNLSAKLPIWALPLLLQRGLGLGDCRLPRRTTEKTGSPLLATSSQASCISTLCAAVRCSESSLEVRLGAHSTPFTSQQLTRKSSMYRALPKKGLHIGDGAHALDPSLKTCFRVLVSHPDRQ